MITPQNFCSRNALTDTMTLENMALGYPPMYNIHTKFRENGSSSSEVEMGVNIRKKRSTLTDLQTVLSGKDSIFKVNYFKPIT